MKIGFFDPYLDTLSGGERYMLTAATCLSQDHDVTIFWNDDEVLAQASRRFNLSFEKLSLSKNLFSAEFSLFERIKKTRKFDYIFFLSDGSIPLTGAKKTVLHFQFPVEWVKTGLLSSLKLKKIDSIICNSYFTKNYIDKKFHVNSSVIYPPVHLFQNNSPKSKSILTVGRFSPFGQNDDYKKIRFMISSFKKILEKGLKGWEFIIITTTFERDKKKLDNLKKECKDTQIKILEDISQAEIEKVFKSAKIYWHAAGYQENIIEHPERMEHFGIVTVEAMSAGCIPIVFNGGGQREIIEDGKNGFLWNTEEELLEKTMRVITSKDIHLENYEKELRAKFSEERFCKEIRRLIT